MEEDSDEDEEMILVSSVDFLLFAKRVEDFILTFSYCKCMVTVLLELMCYKRLVGYDLCSWFVNTYCFCGHLK